MSMKKILLGGFSALFLLVMAGGIAVAGALYWYQAAGPLDAEEVVLIEPGTSFNAIAQKLKQHGVVANALLFRAVTVAKGGHRSFKAGEYRFEAGVSPKNVSDILSGGKSIAHAITIPEGKSSAEIIAILMKDDRLSGMIAQPIPEGTLLPDTHYIHRGDTRASVVARMRRAMQEALPKLWAKRAAALPYDTPEEALVLASIVEKETGVDGERGMVAGVFVNRLRKAMPLQSDPTVVYAIERDKGPMKRPLYRKDWKYESKYNTYITAGLPPAPICHPGLAAIRAVLNPPKHDYLYFVATGKGGHYFAKTLAEHNRNIARYKAQMH